MQLLTGLILFFLVLTCINVATADVSCPIYLEVDSCSYLDNHFDENPNDYPWTSVRSKLEAKDYIIVNDKSDANFVFSYFTSESGDIGYVQNEAAWSVTNSRGERLDLDNLSLSTGVIFARSVERLLIRATGDLPNCQQLLNTPVKRRY